MYLLAARRGEERQIEPGIVQFSEQGRFRFTTELDAASYSLNQLAVFSTGDFLILGWERERPRTASLGETDRKQEQREDFVEPLLAVVNTAGEIEQRRRLGDTESAPSEGAETVSLRSLSLATAVAGDDGFVYLMLREEPARILVLSLAQGIVRNLLVIPPGETLSPMYLHYSQGVGLQVQFGERRGKRRMDLRSSFISLVHPQTGERLVDYRVTPEIGGILGCHTPVVSCLRR